ncbi:MAG: hypothetical protein AAB726_01380 [Patescibacteria group bacterium]
MGIQNQELKKRLGNVSHKDWIKFAQSKGLLVLSGHGSHYANIRNPNISDPKDPRGLISTVTKNCFKEANEEIFKRFLKFGIAEDEIWKGLGFL